MLFFVAAPAHAQFSLDRLDINKLLDTAKNVVKATSDIGEPEEIQIGKDLAARLLGAAPLAKDENLQRYVNRVGRWLALQTERPDLPWQFGVMEAPQLNAFAVPGGTIFVTRGLVERMKSEAELAGVLGARDLARAAQAPPEGDPEGRADRARRRRAQPGAAATSAPTRARSWSRSARRCTRAASTRATSSEADRLGVVIAARAGYDAYGLPAVLQTLQAMNAQDSALALMFKTHPAPGERLTALGETMQPTLDAYASQPQLADRFLQQVKVRK